MNVNPTGTASAMKQELAIQTAPANNSFDELLADIDSGSGGDSDMVSALLEIIVALMDFLKEGKGSESGDSLDNSLSELADSVTALADAMGAGQNESAQPVDVRDANGDGSVSLSESVDFHIARMQDIQDMASSPLDLLAGGRSMDNILG